MKILVAGIGNIFLGDDAFGVEVAQELLSRSMPPGVVVKDFGIRGLDLAYALLDGFDLTILVDACPIGGAPGTVYVIEPDLVESGGAPAMDAHSMNPMNVLRMAQSMGGVSGKILLVGCEPADLGPEEGRMGLTAPVQAAVGEAADLIEKLVARTMAAESIGEVTQVHLEQVQ